MQLDLKFKALVILKRISKMFFLRFLIFLMSSLAVVNTSLKIILTCNFTLILYSRAVFLVLLRI